VMANSVDSGMGVAIFSGSVLEPCLERIQKLRIHQLHMTHEILMEYPVDQLQFIDFKCGKSLHGYSWGAVFG
jgi:hypothetical protein